MQCTPCATSPTFPRAKITLYLSSSQEESTIRAQVKIARKLRAENSHLSAKRYILDAWSVARASAEVSDACRFEVAREVLESGYLDNEPEELTRVMECAVR